jgi:GT2 family glycosyltransferase
MAEGSRPALAVVMATRNRLALLRQALESLLGCIAAAHEIVVVDLGSDDDTPAYLETLPGIRLVRRDGPRGQAADLNPVFAALAARYICWLSDDNVAVPGMLDQAVAILDDQPAIGMVALKVKDVTGPRTAEPYIGGIWPTGVLNCNQGMIRTALFKQIGYFDEAFRTYGVDPDLTTQVLLAGWQVAFTRRVAIHHYRDHAAAPGALTLAARAEEKRVTHRTYEQKYNAFIRPRPLWQRLAYGGFWRAVVRPAYAAARRLGIPLEEQLGYDERDWSNLLYARYVSVFDFLANRGKPFYLVQRMRPGQAPGAQAEAGPAPRLQPSRSGKDTAA